MGRDLGEEQGGGEGKSEIERRERGTQSSRLKYSEYKIESPMFSGNYVGRVVLFFRTRFWHMLFISVFLDTGRDATGHQRPPGSPDARGTENGSTRERGAREDE